MSDVTQTGKKPGNGMATAALILGILSLVIALMQLVNEFFVLLFPFSWILSALSIVFAIIAVAKGNYPKSIVSIIISVLAVAMPMILFS